MLLSSEVLFQDIFYATGVIDGAKEDEMASSIRLKRLEYIVDLAGNLDVSLQVLV